MTTVYTPLGMLGYGFPIKSLKAAVKHGFDVIALDAGSIDPGPYYLGSGKSFTSPTMIERDLNLILEASSELNVPVLIGTAGGSGGIPHVNLVMDILQSVAKKKNRSFKVARIDAEIDKGYLKNKLKDGKLNSFESGIELGEEDIESAVRVVGQMGVDPFIEALKEGVDIIIAGRAYDAAVIAAYPILKGADPALAYHLGKIMECGGMIALPRESDGTIGTIYDSYFTVQPADPDKKSTPDIVAAHTLYEKSNPFEHKFPGGQINVNNASFSALNHRTVAIKGTNFTPSNKYQVKIEGAKFMGYRTICIAGVRDPFVIKNLPIIKEKVIYKIQSDLKGKFNKKDYQVNFYEYGNDAVHMFRNTIDGSMTTSNINEIGIVIEVIATQQDISDTVAALTRSAMLHMGFDDRIANSGNLAFLYTPAEFPAPPAYEFNIYHLIEVENPLELFSIQYIEVGQ